MRTSESGQGRSKLTIIHTDSYCISTNIHDILTQIFVLLQKRKGTGHPQVTTVSKYIASVLYMLTQTDTLHKLIMAKYHK